MKKIEAIFSLLFCCTLVSAQNQINNPVEAFRFIKNVVINDDAATGFRYEMAVRTSASDSIPGIRFYGMATTADGTIYGEQYQVAEKRIEQDWTVFTIAGKLPGKVSTITFYTSLTSAGTYYFDDISLYVEHYPGNWKQLEVANASFEQGTATSLPGYSFINSRSGNPVATKSGSVFKTGKHSLCVSYPEEKDLRIAAGN